MQPSLVVFSLKLQQIDLSHHDQKQGGVAVTTPRAFESNSTIVSL
jgi:hypothetical protein